MSQWKVDVICLPLGFPQRIEAISNAIIPAVQRVVIFAAASNKGLNCSGPAYPARDEKVICINSAHYNGGESDDNPEPIWGQNLSTLGEDVTSAWPIELSSEANPESMKATSGTSVATAIAASIGALLLDFVRQDRDVPPLRWAAEKMRTMDGMKVVLSDMAKKIHRFRYIEPFTYLDGSEDDTELGSFSRRESALNKIFQILRNEFEYKPVDDSLSTRASSAFDGEVRPDQESLLYIFFKSFVMDSSTSLSMIASSPERGTPLMKRSDLNRGLILMAFLHVFAASSAIYHSLERL